MQSVSQEPRGRDIVVIGASAGGVEALTRVVGDFPSDLRAAVFIVLHLGEGTTTALPRILERQTSLPVRAGSVEPATVKLGTVTVAPPDHHLVLEDEFARTLKGPKINRHRPSVDVLFHSAARSYGPRVVGVVLTGSLFDGTLGLRAIKRHGGAAIVQSDAAHEGMPLSALQNVDIDAFLPLQEIAQGLTMFVGTNGEDVTRDETESELEAGFDLSGAPEPRTGPTVFRCPDCGGAMWELDGEVNGYACHVGHTYSAESMLEATEEEVERALWTAVRMLEEKAELGSRLSDRMQTGGNVRSSEHFDSRAREARRQADVLRTVLEASRPEAASR